MKLYLAALTEEDEQEFKSFYNEFAEDGGRIYPGAIKKFNGDFTEFLMQIAKAEDPNLVPPGFVTSDTYALKDETGRIYGMSSLRHRLTEGLLVGGGHIGYGIRPSERNKGFGTLQLKLLLDKCKELVIEKVLITCDKDNPASVKVAINSGGVLGDEITEGNGNILQRYWITLPQIRPVIHDDLIKVLDVIHQSFATVAAEFGITKENCPRHTAFMPIENLQYHMSMSWVMLGLYEENNLVGYVSLSKEGEDVYELHNLAVLPQCRHKGYGKMLIDYVKEAVHKENGQKIKLGIIEENTKLKNWYTANGFVHMGTRKFDHLPFTVGFMELVI